MKTAALLLLALAAGVLAWRRRHRSFEDEVEWSSFDPWLERAGR